MEKEQLMAELFDMLPTAVDKDFARRVWSANPSDYLERLKAINFVNCDLVLDGGSGMGQWTNALSQMNKRVEALEFNEHRVKFSREILNKMERKNVNVVQGSIEELPYKENTFDAVFAYSVIFCADYRKALNEFHRVLRPGGSLYFNSNGLGWYFENILNDHNPSVGFSGKEMAAVAIDTTINYYASGVFEPKRYAAIITPKKIIEQDLLSFGFRNITSADEGQIRINEIKAKSFFKGSYNGLEGVFEYLCYK